MSRKKQHDVTQKVLILQAECGVKVLKKVSECISLTNMVKKAHIVRKKN